MTRQSTLLAVLATVLVVALWWLFVYSPGQEELARIEEEVAAAETETASLQQRVAALEAVRSRAPETEAAIAQVLSIVPDEPALPGALRQIQAAADDAGITMDALVTERPVVLDEAAGLYSAGVTMTATGSYFQLVDFLRRLEDPAITARGFIFDNLSVAPTEHPALTISISGNMFASLEPPPVPADPTTATDAGTPTEAPDDGATDADAATTEETS